MIMRYLLKRFSIAVAILLVMSSLLFVLSRTDDPRHRILNEFTTAEQWEALGEELGLNRPLIVQYVVWIVDSIRIDFGDSDRRSISARSAAFEYITPTLQLLAGGLACSVIFSSAAILTMHYTSKLRPVNKYIGRVARFMFPAIPPFIPGILLAHIFFPHSLLFPTFRGGSWSYVLPSAALGIIIGFVVVKLYDSARTDAANPDCSAENLPSGADRGTASSRPIARLMLLNLLRSSRYYLPVLLAAVIFTELTFDMRGMSKIISMTTLFEDIPLALSAFMILTVAYVAAMLLMDVIRAFLDPTVRKGLSGAAVAERALATGVRPEPSRKWPLFGRRPMVAVVVFGLVILMAVFAPLIVPYSGGLTGADMLIRIFFEFRYVLSTLAFVLFAAAIIGAAMALAAVRFGGMIDRLLVWLFDLFTAFPFLLLGLAGYLVWVTTLGDALRILAVPTYVYVSMYPAGLIALIASGMFFHRVRMDARMSSGPDGFIGSRVVRGILAVAVLSAGPVVMASAIFDVAGVYGAFGWGGPLGKTVYTLVSIWWTLLAGLVLILTILCLNFLGAWLRERLEPQPNHGDDSAEEAPAQ